MRFKLLVPPILTVSLLLAVVPALSQTVAPYQGKSIPLVIGFGPSGFEPDWGMGRMYGGAIWADWYPQNLPHSLEGLGIEAEVRDISLDKHLQPGNSDPQRSGQANTKEDTAGGGVIYSWRHFRNFHPYGKFIVSEGSVDFIGSPTYNHDTRRVLAPGGGFEYRFFRQLWARVDYEYQDWGLLLHETLTPSGFTAGVSYDFSHPLHP
jgi:hypothetical protein